MAVSGAGSTSNMLSSSRMNMTGLATGMNTEEIIQGMTIGTRTKIQKLNQNKTIINWKMDAFRGVTDKLVSLSSKYTSFTSSTNLMSSRFYAKTMVSAMGANASKVSVSGAGHDNMSIAGVKQLAIDASATTGTASKGMITTGEINLDAEINSSKIEGGNLKIKYGGTDITLDLTKGKDYSNPEKIVASLNELLAEKDLNAESKLSDKMKFELDGNKIKLSFKGETAGNSLEITGGSENVLKGLGLEVAVGNPIGEGASIIGAELGDPNLFDDNLFDKKTSKDLIGGKSLTFMLDGSRKTFTLPEADKIVSVEYLKTSLQGQFDAAFGKDTVTVGMDDSKLTFKTKEPTSVLRLTEADSGISGSSGVFGNITGLTNRISLNAKLSDAGFAGFDPDKLETYNMTDKDGNSITAYKMEINGKDIKGITKDTTVSGLMELINNSDAGVKISYMEMSDRFSITSTVSGDAGKAGYTDKIDGKDNLNLAAQLFGASDGLNKKVGQDAIVRIKYKGSDDMVEIKRASNNIDLDGMSVKLNGTFGFDSSDNYIAGTEEIKFEAKADNDKIVDTIKNFVKDYNEMLELVNKQVSTPRPRSSGKVYDPLTDEQRKEMSDKEIEIWEEKAKEGLLFNAPELRSLSSDLRFLLGSEGAAIGIKVSSNYKDNGKLEIDEEALRKALESDPTKVQNFFARPSTGTESGGVMYKLKGTLDKYAKTDGANKGILIQKAGHSSSALSMLDNGYSRELKQLDATILRFERTLKAQEDRYYKQFTNLETFVQRMNMQSGYLTQQFGGGQ